MYLPKPERGLSIHICRSVSKLFNLWSYFQYLQYYFNELEKYPRYASKCCKPCKKTGPIRCYLSIYFETTNRVVWNFTQVSIFSSTFSLDWKWVVIHFASYKTYLKHLSNILQNTDKFTCWHDRSWNFD